MSPPLLKSLRLPDSEARAAVARWPWWFGPLAFVGALTLTLVLTSTLAGVVGALGGTGHRSDHAVALLGTLIQDVSFVVVAVALARGFGRVRPTSFGLRPTRLWPAAGLIALSLLIFYGASAAWAALVSSKGEQDTLAALGTQETAALLIASAIVVIAVAPLAEELFFRGFFYRALRNRLNTTSAVGVVAVLFGAIHYTGPDTLVLLPMLALLGALFCLLYERTASLWPAVGLHVINNGVAFAAGAGRPGAVVVAAGVGVVALGACVLISSRALAGRMS